MSSKLDAYGQFLRYAVEESAASTLTEGNSILTGAYISRQGGQACEIYRILGQLKFPADLPSTGATESNVGTISTRSGLAAMPTLDEEHVIYKRGLVVKAGVGTYLPLIWYANDMERLQIFDPPILVSHSKLYPYVESSNASVLGDFRGYIFFIYVDVDGPLAIEALEAYR